MNIPICPERLLPTAKWTAQVQQEFEALRADVLAAVAAQQQLREEQAAADGGVVFAAAGPALIATALSGKNIEHARLPKPPRLPGLQQADGSLLPDPANWPAWYNYITGRARVPSRKAAPPAAAVGQDTGVGHQPSPEALSSLSDLESTRLFVRAANHLHHHARELEPEVAAWVYGCMARLPQPLHPDTASSMRNMLRQLAAWRSELADVQPADAAGWGRVAALNTLLLLGCSVFGQGDAWHGRF